MKIVIEGNLDPRGSYGIVNVNLGFELCRLGHEVYFLPLDGNAEIIKALCILNDSRFSDLKFLESDIQCDLRIRQIWPPIWTKRHKDEILIVVQPWEFGSIPIAWIEGVEGVDAVWVPSEYVKKGYLQSGIDSDKVWVIPNGIEHLGSVNSMARNGVKTKLLFVGGTIYRKGIDLLFGALASLEESVLARIELVVKDSGSTSFYQNQSLIPHLVARFPEVAKRMIYIDQHLSRTEVRELIRSSDALIQPYRAEGFAMPILEAMSLGTLAVHTGGGPSGEFCPESASFHIPSKAIVQDMPYVGDLLLSDYAYLREPDQNSLTEIVTEIVNGVDFSHKVDSANAIARKYEWQEVGLLASRAIDQLVQGNAPDDKLSSLGAKLKRFFDGEQINVLPLVSELNLIGDFVSSRDLLGLNIDGNSESSEKFDLISLKKSLDRLAASEIDLWSGGCYRGLVASQLSRRDGKGYFNSFEGDDEVTFRIANFLAQNFTTSKRVVDIGCGQGSMLRALRNRGKSLIGIDEDSRLVSELIDDGFEVIQGFVPNCLNSGEIGAFDGVFMGHIVEHLDSKAAESLIKWIFDNIDDDGILVIQTLDFANSDVSSNGFSLDPTYIRPYSIPLLKKLLRSSGFNVLEGRSRRISEIAPLDIVVVARRPNRGSGQISWASSNEDVVQIDQQSKIHHIGLFDGRSGFSKASIALLQHINLDDLNAKLYFSTMAATSESATADGNTWIPANSIDSLKSDIVVVDLPVLWIESIAPLLRSKYRIARTTFEANPLPGNLVDVLNGFDEVWTMSRFDFEIFRESGVLSEKLRIEPVLPQRVSADINPTARYESKKKEFTFLSIFDFQSRKDPITLVRAFSRVRAKYTGAKLIVKLSGIERDAFFDFLRNSFTSDELKNSLPGMSIITEFLDDQQMDRLYKLADVFVLPSHGEGFGLPFFEAMQRGIVSIAPDQGGQIDYCHASNSFLVRTIETPAVTSSDLKCFRDSNWYQCALEDLTSKMEYALVNSDLLVNMAKSGLVRIENWYEGHTSMQQHLADILNSL
ncbi:glycosyltransferase [Acidithrix ferrooxidans]|uniref:D-inositol-3-phosphate glycosyltransferase n=1 Tax=Acidithrix ferrooxidans TaxID=1280514 RepID=A0A0D8HJL9_9ACTN|nr:glycosyltransferase [Acidithrix ferrooxidans]KJF17957.1 D-inositol-3-phosphate glycosyltransferase [Acidithrix ferrooxidans]